MGSRNYFDRKTPSRIIYSDASNSGWRAISESNKTRDPFSLEENEFHVNAG